MPLPPLPAQTQLFKVQDALVIFRFGICCNISLSPLNILNRGIFLLFNLANSLSILFIISKNQLFDLLLFFINFCPAYPPHLPLNLAHSYFSTAWASSCLRPLWLCNVGRVEPFHSGWRPSTPQALVRFVSVLAYSRFLLGFFSDLLVQSLRSVSCSFFLQTIPRFLPLWPERIQGIICFPGCV